MAIGPTTRADSFMQLLPSIYRDDPFLGRFLLAFEQVLLGADDGLEQEISKISTYFDPYQTREDFLPWLATWTAFTLRADLPKDRQRDFIANIAQRYQYRGTKRNLEELLTIFTIGTPVVTEEPDVEVQIGVHSTIGQDMYVGGPPPHHFQVTIRLPEALRSNPRELARQLEITRSLIELEKPAHTHYDLELVGVPTMQIGFYSRVGVDTLLGTIPEG